MSNAALDLVSYDRALLQLRSYRYREATLGSI